MATEVAVITGSTGSLTFYSTYAAARSAATSGDLIQIWADLTEQIILKDGVDISIIPGRVLDFSSALCTITDNNTALECNIFGAGIIKNTYNENYPTGPYYECVKILNGASKVFMQCDYLEGAGGVEPDTIDGSTVKVSGAAKFHLTCNKIISQSNVAVEIANCGDINIQTQKIEGGNNGSPVVVINGSGFITSEELTSTGKGTCLHLKDGTLNANISKITSQDIENEGYPTVLLDDGTESQNLILYFDEIQNLNTNGGDALKITEGTATLTGRRIYALDGMSLNLTNNIISALIQCEEIISGTKGVNIANSDEAVIIDANYIEGSNGNDGVIKSASGSNYMLRNAKIKNVSTASDSVCIFISSGPQNDQTIEIENLILVTGNTTNGDTIKRDTTNTIDIKNLGLFVNKGINRNRIILKIGTGTEGNYKYIESSDIT